MNFGYPFTPFQTPMQEEMMEMNYMNQQQPMQQMMKPCQMMPQSSCNQVVQKQFVEEMPYYVDYHTHIVNNVVRKHIQIPVYSQSQETVYFDEWQMGCGCNR
jgi:hypothetical protein